jgi:lysyl-tRNA synthetase class II
VYLRFYNHASSTTDTASRAGTSYGSTTTKPTTAPAEIKEKDHAIHIIERAKELKQAYSLLYPRINNDKNAVSIAEFTNAYKDLGKGESISNDGRTLRGMFMLYERGQRSISDNMIGRIMNFRIAGKGLAFLDISQDGQATQIVCDLAHLKVDSNKQFSTFYHLIQRGDVICQLFQPPQRLCVDCV